MREALFIKKNRDRWQTITHDEGKHPDEQADDFIQLVEDLGYSKTFYPHSRITQYLNKEASKKYLNIYENSRESGNRFTRFFKYTLPETVGRHHRMLLVTFCLFITFVAIGFFSAKGEQTFVREVLGNSYVDMTEKNIQKGKPFEVYDDGNELLMFIRIFINNISVALHEFAGGILLGIPTVMSLVSNSIMVGTFEYLFYQHGIIRDSVLTILIHGTLELFSIVVSSTAGLVLATSWLFPRNKTRMDALKSGAKDGLIIALSGFPTLLMAAFFEGFVTRHADMPLWLKLVIVFSSLSFIIAYFIIYPIRLKQARRAAISASV